MNIKGLAVLGIGLGVYAANYDVALKEVISPAYCDSGLYPGYYVEDHTPVDFKIKIFNQGTEELTDDSSHRFRAFAITRDMEGGLIDSFEVNIPRLGTRECLIVDIGRWKNSGEGSENYNLLMYVNFNYVNGADEDPSNDSIEVPLQVLWTNDIACTRILEPSEPVPPGERIFLSAVFKNLGISDTINMPITGKVYNAEDENPPDSLLVQF